LRLVVSSADWLVRTDIEAINRVYQLFVVRMNPQCRNEVGACAYHSASSTYGCAVACLITALKREVLQQQCIGILGSNIKSLVRNGYVHSQIPVETLASLQNWHDNIDRQDVDSQETRHNTFPFLHCVQNPLSFEVAG
jgi:hypothetical protein